MDRMEFLNTRIDELKAQIAKDKLAHSFGQELYNSRYGNDPRYNTAMLEYILSGDRSGIDAYAGTVQAHQQMEANKALMEAQQKQEAAYKQDEYQKNYNLAAADYDYAYGEWAKDKKDAGKIRALKNARTNANYWGGQLGYDLIPDETQETAPVTPEPQPVPQEPIPQTQSEIIASAKAILGKKEFTDEDKAKLNELKGQITDAGVLAEIDAAISNKGKTSEQKKAASDAKLKSAKEAYSKMKVLERIQYEQDHPEFEYSAGKIKGYKKK